MLTTKQPSRPDGIRCMNLRGIAENVNSATKARRYVTIVSCLETSALPEHNALTSIRSMQVSNFL